MAYTLEIEKKLVDTAKNYDSVEEFINDITWERALVAEILDKKNALVYTKDEVMALNEILVSSFEKAHGVKFQSKYRLLLISDNW